MARAITQHERQRGAHSSARETQSRGGSLDGTALRGASAVSNRKSARVKISAEAPPPKSLEVEPGNEANVIFWMM